MAMSAFRSTTRRNCQIDGYSSSAEAGGVPVPSTPRSKRDPSPSGRGLHRRSASVSDFSARYLSDCSSTSEFRPSHNKSSRTGRHSVCPSDSESDMDSLSAHRQRHRRWGADSEDERPANSSRNKTGMTKSEQKGLRRTWSSQDFSQSMEKGKQHVAALVKKDQGGDTENLVEEKTVRAVYAQMKSMHTDPPAGDVGITDFLDAMRTEVRRAVADIRTELEESMRKNNHPSLSSNEENRPEPQGTDVIQAVADIRKEYTTKLEESEKRVRELWSQIAVEERRCLELSKIVKELLPTQPPVAEQAAIVSSSSSRRRSHRRKNSAEGQQDSRSLDEEAQRYFEEYVSISSYGCQGDSDDSMVEKKNNSRQKITKEVNANQLPTGTDGKGDEQLKGSSFGSDGVVLPWLQWEAEAGASCDRDSKQVERSGKVVNNKSSLHKFGGSFTQSSHSKMNASKNPTKSLAVSSWSGSRELEINSDLLDFEQQPCASLTALFNFDNDTTLNKSTCMDDDSVLFDKIKFRCRVERGELLLCHGLFLM